MCSIFSILPVQPALSQLPTFLLYNLMYTYKGYKVYRGEQRGVGYGYVVEKVSKRAKVYTFFKLAFGRTQ